MAEKAEIIINIIAMVLILKYALRIRYVWKTSRFKDKDKTNKINVINKHFDEI